jgi:lysophospholipid acyltransferase (LPLAT)-like uncharacterized protein
MRWSKRLLRNEGARRLLCAVGAAYVWFVYRTTHWQIVGREAAERLWAEQKPFLGCFWHGRMLLMPFIWSSERPFAMLISRHPDGQFIARTIAHFGIDAIAGSSSSGGGDALRSIVKTLKSGISVGITPDGPRGPRMRASIGAIHAARLARVALVPVAVATSRRFVLDSWDRFIVALPFGRGAFVWGRPIHIPVDADADAIESLRRDFENELNRVSAEADRLVGQSPIEPAAAETVAA